MAEDSTRHLLQVRPRSASTASSPRPSPAPSCPAATLARRESPAGPRARSPGQLLAVSRRRRKIWIFFLRLKVAGPRRYLQPIPVRRPGLLASSGSLQRPAEPAMGGRVVRLEPDRLRILDDRALGLPGLEVGARQTEPDHWIVRHQLGHLLELGDPITLSHGRLRWIRSSGTSTRWTPLKLNRSSTL